MTVLVEARCLSCGARISRVGLVAGDEHVDGCSGALDVDRAWSLTVTTWQLPPLTAAQSHFDTVH